MELPTTQAVDYLRDHLSQPGPGMYALGIGAAIMILGYAAEMVLGKNRRILLNREFEGVMDIRTKYSGFGGMFHIFNTAPLVK